MTGKIAAIVNPCAGHGKTARIWPGLSKTLVDRMGPITARFTEHSGHGMSLARELVEQAFDLIIVVGGDGTLNEVANGLLDHDRPLRPETCLGILPLGTGGDFQRTLGIPSKQEAAIDILATGNPLLIDMGKASFCGHDATTKSRYFVNLVSFGMGGEVAGRAKNFLSPLGGTVSFLYATLSAFLTYRARTVTLRLDDKPDKLTFSISNIAVGNGRYHGGGMHVCPRAILNDGRLDVTVIERLGMIELMRDLPVLYSDDIYRHPKTRHLRAEKIVAEAAEPTWIEIDGEPLGKLPLEISVLPHVLQVLVPQSTPSGRY
jgi:YegS/Rv2252/BmrU family lipid kinase